MFEYKSTIQLLTVAAVAFGSGAFALTGSAARAANIINNGGFETAPTNPPTPNDFQFNGAGAGQDGTNPHSGSFEADLNNTTEGSNANVLEQTAAGSVTPGTMYTLSYYTELQGVGGGIGQAQFEFLDSNAGILAGSPVFENLPSTSPATFGTPAGYEESTFNFTAPANASEIFLSFNAVTGANSGDTSHVYVDDVSFTSASTAMPEPASLGVLVLGGLAIVRRRRQQA